MSEADEGVCICAVILTDIWDHLQEGSNGTEMRHCLTLFDDHPENQGKVVLEEG